MNAKKTITSRWAKVKGEGAAEDDTATRRAGNAATQKTNILAATGATSMRFPFAAPPYRRVAVLALAFLQERNLSGVINVVAHGARQLKAHRVISAGDLFLQGGIRQA